MYDFPASPTDGQTSNGYTYSAAAQCWLGGPAGSSGGGASISVSDTPPAGPLDNQMWFESDTGITWIYYNDGNTKQWVQMNSAPGAFLPLTGGTLSGDLTIAKPGPTITLNQTVAGASGAALYMQRAGAQRWAITTYGADSGSNAGSDLYYSRFNDGGTQIDNPLIISRATGRVTLSNKLTMTQDFNSGGVDYTHQIYFNPTGYADTLGIRGYLQGGVTAGVSQVVGPDYMNFAAGGYLTISGPSATKSAGTTWANPSDERIKENIADYPQGLDAIVGLRPVMFNYKTATKQPQDTYVGLVAQEAEQVMPGIVTTAQGGMGELQFDDFKSLDASNVIWALVNAVKELKAELDALKGVSRGV